MIYRKTYADILDIHMTLTVCRNTVKEMYHKTKSSFYPVALILFLIFLY
jgi:hypothetical protein